MTDEIYHEMRNYRQLAVQIENELNEKRKKNNNEQCENNNPKEQQQQQQLLPISSRSEDYALEELNSQYIKISSLINYTDDEHNNNASPNLKENNNTIKKKSISLLNFQDHPQLQQIENNNNIDNNLICDNKCLNTDNILSNISNQLSPRTARCNRSSSDVLDKNRSITFNKLIRSNSYTLEVPSPMLIKHMESKGVNINLSPTPPPPPPPPMVSKTMQQPTKENALNDTITVVQAIVTNKEIPNKIIVKKFKPKTIPRKSTTNSISGHHSTNNIKTIKYRKSPYDGKTLKNMTTTLNLNKSLPCNNNNNNTINKKKLTTSLTNISRKTGKTKQLNKKSINTKSTNDLINTTSTMSTSTSSTTTITNDTNTSTKELNNNDNNNIKLFNQNQLNDILKQIEDEHKNQINFLIQRQQEEYEKLQLEFLEQNKRLMNHLNNNNNIKVPSIQKSISSSVISVSSKLSNASASSSSSSSICDAEISSSRSTNKILHLNGDNLISMENHINDDITNNNNNKHESLESFELDLRSPKLLEDNVDQMNGQKCTRNLFPVLSEMELQKVRTKKLHLKLKSF